MGISDWFKSDEEKLKEKRNKFEEIEPLFQKADSIYQNMQNQYPEMVPDDIQQMMELLRNDFQATKAQLYPEGPGVQRAGEGKGQRRQPQIVDAVTRAAEKAPEKVSFYPEGSQEKPINLFQEAIVRPAQTFKSGYYEAAGTITNTLDQWSRFIEESANNFGIPMDRGQVFARLSQFYMQKAQESAAKGIDPKKGAATAVANYLYGGLGRLSVDLPAIMATGLPAYSAVSGGAAAYEQGENIWKGTLVGGLEGLILHGALKSINAIPLPERSVLGAGIFGSPTAIQMMSMDPEDRDYAYLVSELLIGAGLVGFHRGKARKDLVRDARETLGKDFEPLRNRLKEIAEDKEINRYAQERAAFIADLMQTPEGRAFVERMRPFETFQDARKRIFNENINRRWEQIRQMKEAEQRRAAELELKQRQAEGEIEYLKMLGAEEKRIDELDDMAAAYTKKMQKFWQDTEEIMKRAAIEKSTYQGEIPIIQGAATQLAAPGLATERPTKEILDEARKEQSFNKKTAEAIRRAEERLGELPEAEEGPSASRISKDKEKPTQAASELAGGKGKEGRSEDLEQPASGRSGPSETKRVIKPPEMERLSEITGFQQELMKSKEELGREDYTQSFRFLEELRQKTYQEIAKEMGLDPSKGLTIHTLTDKTRSAVPSEQPLIAMTMTEAGKSPDWSKLGIEYDPKIHASSESGIRKRPYKARLPKEKRRQLENQYSEAIKPAAEKVPSQPEIDKVTQDFYTKQGKAGEDAILDYMAEKTDAELRNVADYLQKKANEGRAEKDMEMVAKYGQAYDFVTQATGIGGKATHPKAVEQLAERRKARDRKRTQGEMDMEMTVQEFHDTSYYEKMNESNRVQEVNAPEIQRLEKRLSEIKIEGTRGEERKRLEQLKKEIQEDINKLKSEYEILEAEAEREAIVAQEKMEDLFRKRAKEQGLDLSKLKNEDEAVTSFMQEIGEERPYIETNYNRKISEIADEIIRDYKQAEKPETIGKAADAIAEGQKAIKDFSMKFQGELKLELAEKLGLKFEDMDKPINQWMKIREIYENWVNGEISLDDAKKQIKEVGEGPAAKPQERLSFKQFILDKGYKWEEVSGEGRDPELWERLKREFDEAVTGEPSKRPEPTKKGYNLKQAEKLRELADNMQSQIDDKFGDRLANTPKRVREAESARAEGERLKEIQGTMRNIADAFERGEDLKYLLNVRSKTDIEFLQRMAKLYEYQKSRDPAALKMKDWLGARVHKSHIREFLKDLEGLKGISEEKQALSRLIQFGEDVYQVDVSSVEPSVRHLLKKLKKSNRDYDKYAVKEIEDALKEYRRQQDLAIVNVESLIGAIEEYNDLKGGQLTPEQRRAERIRQMEGELVGTKMEGYFPTPKEVGQKMLNAANIEPGDKILEPSAGKGSLADMIKKEHPGQLEVVEIVPTLQNLLKEKGHKLVGSDFLEHQGRYDVIVMNPPYEKMADIDHVMKAWELLNPGGRIVSLMSEGPFFRQDKKAVDFRKFLEDVGGYSEKLPEKSFGKADRPTGVAVRMVVIEKGGNKMGPDLTERIQQVRDMVSTKEVKNMKAEDLKQEYEDLRKIKADFSAESAEIVNSRKEKIYKALHENEVNYVTSKLGAELAQKITLEDIRNIADVSINDYINNDRNTADLYIRRKKLELEEWIAEAEKNKIKDDKAQEAEKDLKEDNAQWLDSYEDLPISAKPARYVSSPNRVGKGKSASPEDQVVKNITKRSSLRILENVLVQNGQMVSYNFEGRELFVVGRTDLADGVYLPVGKNFEKQTNIRREDFPEVPIVFRPSEYTKLTTVTMDMPFNELKRMLRAVSDDELRAALTNVHLQFDKGTNKLQIQATDGHRLSRNTITMDNKWDINKPDIMLNSDAIKLLLRDKGLDKLTIDVFQPKVKEKDHVAGRTYIQIRTPDYSIIFREADETYVDADRVLPGKLGKIVRFDRDQLSAALNEAKEYAYESGGVKIDMVGFIQKGSDYYLVTQDPDRGLYKKIKIDAQEVGAGSQNTENFHLLMPVRWDEGKPSGSFAQFNRPYLKEAVDGINGKDVFIGQKISEANKLRDDYAHIIYGADPRGGRTKKGYETPPKSKTVNRTSRSGSHYREDLHRSLDDDMVFQPRIKNDFKESDLNDIVTLRGIGRNLVKSMEMESGKDVRMGFIRRFSRKAKGIFFPDSGIIRVNNLNDVSTLAHEIGHKLDIEIFGIEKQVAYEKRFFPVNASLGIKDPKKRAARIKKLTEKYGQEFIDMVMDRKVLRDELKAVLEEVKYPKSARSTKEGIAEFTSNYVINPDMVKRVAPRFYELFENILDTQPNLRKALLDAREQVSRFAKQDPRQITASTIAYETQEGQLLKNLKRLPKYPEEFFTNVLDGTQPFRELEKQLLKVRPDIKGSESPLKQVLSLVGIQGKAEQFLHNHPFRRTGPAGSDVEILSGVKPLIGNRTNPGILYPILKNGTLKQIESYLVAKRNIELIENGLGGAATTGRTIAENTIRLSEQTLGKRYLEQIQQDLWNYQKSLLDYYYQSGKLSEKAYNKSLEYHKFYVPFKRMFHDFEIEGNFGPLSKYVKDTSPSPVKKIRKSKREVLPVFGSIIKNTYDILTAADRNYALRTMVNSLQTVEPSLVQEIPKKTWKKVVALVGPDKIIDPVTGDIMVAPDSSPFKEVWAISTERPRNQAIISVWNEGDVKYYQIPKRYYEAYISVNEPVGKAVRFLAAPARWLRAGAVVYDPTFAVRNVSRDQLSAWFYSKFNYNPWYFVKGVSDAMNKTETYQKFLASGADQSFLTAVDREMSKGYIEKRAGKRIQTKWQEYKRNPLFLLQDINRASELGTRVGAFRNAYKKTGDIYLAMQEAREISGDYGVKGQAMKNFAPLYPFFNARLQHLKLQSQAALRPGRFIAKGLPIVGMAMVNYYYNHRDTEVEKLYNELPTWRKIGMFNIHIPGTDSFIPIPRGALGILFGATTEHYLDYLREKDPETLADIGREFLQDSAPISSPVELAPQFARPIAEQFANKVGYTGRPIVSERLKYLDPPEQYDDYTSEIMKILGKATGTSPKRLQHLFVSYTAGTGRAVLNIGDEALELAGVVEPSPEDMFTKLSKLPITKAFVTETPLGTRGQSVQKFYEELDEMQRISRTVDRMNVEEQDEKLVEFLTDERQEKYRWYLENKKSVNRFREILRIARFMKRKIWHDTTIPDRRKRIKELDLAITNLAIQFNNAYAENRQFRIHDLMRQLHRYGKSIEKGESRQRQKMRKYFKSESEFQAAMGRLELYKKRKSQGLLSAKDRYRMEALQQKINEYNALFK